MQKVQKFKDMQPTDREISTRSAMDDWQPLGPGFSIPPKHKDGLPSHTFGPELGFASAMLEADSNPKSEPKQSIDQNAGATN